MDLKSLETVLSDPAVSEILTAGITGVILMKNGRPVPTPELDFPNMAALKTFAKDLAGRNGVVFDGSSSVLFEDRTLGARVSIALLGDGYPLVRIRRIAGGKGKKLSVYLNGDLIAAIEDRGGRPGESDTRGRRSAVIARDLGRLYDLYRLALAEFNLSVDEALLICDVVGGPVSRKFVRPVEPLDLYSGIEGSIVVHDTEEKWGVDPSIFMPKVREMTPTQKLALFDAAERFWMDADKAENDTKAWAAECFGIQAEVSGTPEAREERD